MKVEYKSRFASIPKRSFRNSVIHLMEHNYKLVGSHKVLAMMADDIVELHPARRSGGKEYYPDTSKIGWGSIVWQTTAATEKKPSYGTKVEEQQIKTVILPLVTLEDVEDRIHSHYRRGKDTNQKKQAERDVKTMSRLVKSAHKQGGLLTGAELAVLMNRSLNAIGR